MEIIVNDNVVSDIKFKYPFAFSLMDSNADRYSHEKLATWLFENKKHLSIYMFIVEAEHIADDLWDDPNYIYKTNNIVVCDAISEVRKHMTNRWFSREQLDAIIEKEEMPTWKYNYKDKEEGERDFRYLLEDALFQFQEQKEMIKLIISYLDGAKYKSDEDGYVIETDEGDYELETDPDQIEKNKEKLLDKLLMPHVWTTNERVYSMPEPFHRWDYRSFWHQFFFVENHKTQQTYWERGQGGGSASREANGRWTHTLATLEKKYGVPTLTHHLIYNERNKLVLDTVYPSFKCLHYDLNGNYHADYNDVKVLFDGFLIDSKINPSF